MSDLLTSIEWEQQPNETIEIYMARTETQKETWRLMVRHRGQCYMVKFGDNDIRPMWEDQIDTGKLAEIIKSPIGMPLDCPLCQPYDNFDNVANIYRNRRYMTKIINQRYPEGFVDREGVWIKCPCLKKGEDRKYLKFKAMRAPHQSLDNMTTK